MTANEFFNDPTCLKALLAATFVVLIIVVIILIIARSRYTSLYSEVEERGSTIKSMLPYKIGTVKYYDYSGYDTYEDTESDDVVSDNNDSELPIGTIIMQPTAQLAKVRGNEISSDFLEFFDVMDEFYEDPALLLDKFYKKESHYGFPVELSRSLPYDFQHNAPVIKALDGSEYAIIKMDRFPKHLHSVVRLIKATRTRTNTNN